MKIIHGKEVFTTVEELVDPQYTALVLIDIQNDYITPGGAWDVLGDKFILGQFVPNTKRVLDTARHNNILIAHIQFTVHADYVAESPAFLRSRLIRKGDKYDDSNDKTPYCIDGTWGWQIIDELTPQPNEVVIKKHRPSSFIGTNLDLILRSNDIRGVVLVGLVTQGCVLATANDTQAFGYCPVILRDCVVSHKPILHDAALLVMSGDKDVVDSGEVIKVWGENDLH